MIDYVPFFKVIIIKVDLLESTIIDERHFRNDIEANSYAESMRKVGYIPVVAVM